MRSFSRVATLPTTTSRPVAVGPRRPHHRAAERDEHDGAAHVPRVQQRPLERVFTVEMRVQSIGRAAGRLVQVRIGIADLPRTVGGDAENAALPAPEPLTSSTVSHARSQNHRIDSAGHRPVGRSWRGRPTDRSAGHSTNSCSAPESCAPGLTLTACRARPPLHVLRPVSCRRIRCATGLRSECMASSGGPHELPISARIDRNGVIASVRRQFGTAPDRCAISVRSRPRSGAYSPVG